jgi:hypothetical protein
MSLSDMASNWMKDNHIKIRSPLIGAFISSWVLFNWDRFLVLFWGDGELSARLELFQDTTNFSDSEFFWYPFLLALLYVFLLPYINTFTQYLLGHASKWSHEISVDIDIEKEKKIASLNEEKYKSNPEKDFLGKKITFELDKHEAESKKAKADAEKSENEAKNQKVETEKAVHEQELASIELAKKKLKTEKEAHNHELTKSMHQHRLSCLRFPLAYQYIKTLSDQLLEQETLVKMDTLADAVATAFGYQSRDELFNDEKFNQESLENLSFVIYDSQKLLLDLEKIVKRDSNQDFDEESLFDYLIETFQILGYCKFISDESIDEEATTYICDNQYNIIELDAVNNVIAETNAFFDEVNIEQAEQVNIDHDTNRYEVDFSGTVSGTNHENKMFNGDTIDVSFTLTYPTALGRRGLGKPDFEDVKAVMSHPDDHSYT